MQKAEKTATIGTGKQMWKAEKTATIGTGKQMQKTEKNGYHRNWETNAESRKKQLPWELGNKYGEQKKTATIGAGKQIWRALNYYKKRE